MHWGYWFLELVRVRSGWCVLIKSMESRQVRHSSCFFVVDGMGNRRRGRRGAVERSSSDLFYGLTHISCALPRKTQVFQADSAGLADGLVTGCLGIRQLAEWDSWKINQPTTTNFDGTQQNIAWAYSHQFQPSRALAPDTLGLQRRCQWVHHLMA
jgi:hypothetical protein